MQKMLLCVFFPLSIFPSHNAKIFEPKIFKVIQKSKSFNLCDVRHLKTLQQRLAVYFCFDKTLAAFNYSPAIFFDELVVVLELQHVRSARKILSQILQVLACKKIDRGSKSNCVACEETFIFFITNLATIKILVEALGLEQKNDQAFVIKIGAVLFLLPCAIFCGLGIQEYKNPSHNNIFAKLFFRPIVPCQQEEQSKDLVERVESLEKTITTLRSNLAAAQNAQMQSEQEAIGLRRQVNVLREQLQGLESDLARAQAVLAACKK